MKYIARLYCEIESNQSVKSIRNSLENLDFTGVTDLSIISLEPDNLTMIEAARELFQRSDLNGYQLVDADEWVVAKNMVCRVFYAEAVDELRPHSLLIEFKPGTTNIIKATIDGEDLNG